jgi:hypothetical protein
MLVKVKNMDDQPTVHARLLEPDVLSWSESALLLGAFMALAVSMVSFITI